MALKNGETPPSGKRGEVYIPVFSTIDAKDILGIRLMYPKPRRTEVDNVLKDTATHPTAETVGVQRQKLINCDCFK